MSNALQFSLGLTAGGFINALDRAGSKVQGFTKHALTLGSAALGVTALIGTVSSLHNVVEGVFGAIERGAQLEYLSKRTDTSVASLFELQKGFKAVGLSADDVGPMIFKMQKALGGVNEFGEDTRSVFFRMGLSLDDLKQRNAVQQFQLIGNALGRLNSTGAASAASSIFGREGSANMVQLSRSTGDFTKAMQAAARDAQTFEQNAAVFATLERSLDKVKGRTQTLFAGMAAGAAPAIQMVVDQLNSIDLTSVGQQIGQVFTAFTQAFREGKVSDLLALTIKTGFKDGLTWWWEMIPAALEYFGAVLIKAFTTPLEYLQAGMTYAAELAMEGFGKLEDIFHSMVNILTAGIDWAMQKLIQGLAKIPKLNKALGIEGFQADTYGKILADQQKANPNSERFKADSFSDILADRKKEGLKFNLGTGEFDANDIISDATDRWRAGMQKIKDQSAPLLAMVDGLASRAPKAKAEAHRTNQQGLDMPMKNDYKPAATSLEKMGFVMGGMQNSLEFARRTAIATERIAASISRQQPAGPPTLGQGLNLN